MSLVVFFTEMLQLARQEIAELFLGLVLLLLVNKSMEKSKWTLLFLIFTFSLVLSHYGLTYLFIGMIVVTWAASFLISKIKPGTVSDLNRRLTPLILIGMAGLLCHMVHRHVKCRPVPDHGHGRGQDRQPICRVGNDLYLTPATIPGTATNLTTGQTNEANGITQPLAIITTSKVSILHDNYLYILLATQAMIVLGILSSLLFKGTFKFTREYYTLAFINVSLLALALVVPMFASSLNTTRLYQITLIFLAPFIVAGWVNFFRLPELVTRRTIRGLLPASLALLSIFLVVYLVFNTGLIFEVFKDVPMSYSLNNKNENMTYTIYNTMEVAGAEWMLDKRAEIARANNESFIPPVFSDTTHMLLLQDWNATRSYKMPNKYMLPTDTVESICLFGHVQYSEQRGCQCLLEWRTPELLYGGHVTDQGWP